MDEMRNAYKILVGQSKGKDHFVSPKRRLEYKIKVYLKETKCGVVD
jgi:hypothetical protein